MVILGNFACILVNLPVCLLIALARLLLQAAEDGVKRGPAHEIVHLESFDYPAFRKIPAINIAIKGDCEKKICM